MPKIQLPPNIKKLKEQLESGHNLVDHFLLCGIPPSTCLQDFLYDYKNEKFEEIFKENIKPSIISKFPEFDNSIDSIDEEIINYCFPDGFVPIITSKKGIGGKIFSVILDNNLFSSEYPQKFLTCLLFYENLSVYKDLKSKLEKNKEKDKIIEEEKEEIKEEIKKQEKEKEEKKEEEKDLFDIEEVEEKEIASEHLKELKGEGGEKNNEELKKGNSEILKNGDEKDKDIKKEKEDDDVNDFFKKKVFSSVIIPNKDNYKKLDEETILKTTILGQKSNRMFLKRSSFISEKGNVFIPKCICIV